ncbi:MAG: phage holin family protein [Polyangiales bacterium]
MTEQHTERSETNGPGAEQHRGAAQTGTQTQQERRERSTRSLARELVGELSALVFAEVALAKSETQQKITQAERGVAAMSFGAAIFAAGLLVLLAAAVIGLAIVLPMWLSALIIGGGVALIGAVVLSVGRRNVSTKELELHRTKRSLRKARRFAGEQKAQATEAWQ